MKRKLSDIVLGTVLWLMTMTCILTGFGLLFGLIVLLVLHPVGTIVSILVVVYMLKVVFGVFFNDDGEFFEDV